MATGSNAKGEEVSRLFSRKYVAPLFFYRLKDVALSTMQKPTFLDTAILVAAFVAGLFAVPFYPWPVAILLVVALFAASIYHPYLGLIVLMGLAMPALMYQVPALAWLFLFVVTFTLVYGYKYYRTIAFSFMMIALAFSSLGYLFALPAFVFAALIIGRKRMMLMAVLFVLGVVMLSGITGVQNSAYVLYSPVRQVANTSVVALYATPSKPTPSILGFSSDAGAAFSTFATPTVAFGMMSVFSYAFGALAVSPVAWLVELGFLMLLAYVIDEFVINSRSKRKGMEASIIGIAYPLFFIVISTVRMGQQVPYILVAISAAIAPFLTYMLQIYDIDVIKALDVRKEDIRMKFGEAFEDLQFGTSLETFRDIGDYESTKTELRDAVLDPIEERSVARAYNITPAKGLLFFGPPGTGKTMMMRALANEIHAAFYYVKASDLLSAFAGESERKIANIFAIARKHQPCVLFFDEIDSIGGNRENAGDQARARALSQLLIELDGFQKLERVIFVGATNVPDTLDPALIRAGRVDKIIYMPLPDAAGRKKILEIYLKRYPLAQDIDLNKLVERTQRYSGADIKAVCNSVAQGVAQEAATEHKVLRITQKDITDALSSIKPSTSLAQLEMYTKFKIKFERSMHEEKPEASTEKLDLDSVVGMAGVKKALIEAIQIPLLHPDLMEKYKVKSIKGILMFGPPGNGKTMLMRAAMSDETLKGVKILEINGSDLASQGMDRANASIKDAFNTARENEPCVIFIDEIDGIAPARSTGTQETSEITTELLKQMDGLEKPYGIVVIAATNRPEVLDAAILRPGRFDKLVFVRPPGPRERAQLFRQYLSGAPSEGLDFDALGKASEGYTGADIANICREAKTMALEKAVRTGEESQVSKEDLLEIIGDTRPSAPADSLGAYTDFAARYARK